MNIVASEAGAYYFCGGGDKRRCARRGPGGAKQASLVVSTAREYSRCSLPLAPGHAFGRPTHIQKSKSEHFRGGTRYEERVHHAVDAVCCHTHARRVPIHT